LVRGKLLISNEFAKSALLYILQYRATYNRARRSASLDAWSPADHVRHLTKVMRALTRGLLLARFKLVLRFGLTFRASRTYDQIRETYLARLPAFTGPNPFAAKTVDALEDADAWRNNVMMQYDATLNELTGAIAKWSERALDRLRLPHMLIGKLTVREMLLFVLYHNLHHIKGVTRKLS
jgi:hypothetical protein